MNLNPAPVAFGVGSISNLHHQIGLEVGATQFDNQCRWAHS